METDHTKRLVSRLLRWFFFGCFSMDIVLVATGIRLGESLVSITVVFSAVCLFALLIVAYGHSLFLDAHERRLLSFQNELLKMFVWLLLIIKMLSVVQICTLVTTSNLTLNSHVNGMPCTSTSFWYRLSQVNSSGILLLSLCFLCFALNLFSGTWCLLSLGKASIFLVEFRSNLHSENVQIQVQSQSQSQIQAPVNAQPHG